MPQRKPDIIDLANRAPIIGGFISNAHQVQRIMTTPCDPDPYLFALGNFHALPTMIWSIFGPDCLDLAYDRAGRPHGRKRKGKWNATGYTIGVPSGGGFGWRFFNLADMLQKGGFILAVADATSDFFINSMTTAMVFEGCGVAGAPYALLGPQTMPNIQTGGPDWEFITWNVIRSNIFGAGGSTVQIPPNYTYASALSVQVQPVAGFPPPSSVEVRIVDIESGVTVAETATDDAGGGNREGSAVYLEASVIHGGHTLQSQCRTDVPCHLTGSHWNVSGHYTGAGLGPFGCGGVSQTDQTTDAWWEEYLEGWVE